MAENDTTWAFQKIFDAAYNKAGSTPEGDDQAMCEMLWERSNAHMDLAESYRSDGQAHQAVQFETRAHESQMAVIFLAKYLAEKRAQ